MSNSIFSPTCSILVEDMNFQGQNSGHGEISHHTCIRRLKNIHYIHLIDIEATGSMSVTKDSDAIKFK